MRSPAAVRSRFAPLVLALLLLCASTSVAVGAPAAAATAADGEAPRTSWEITVQSDGDARFTIAMRFHLDSANETRAFRRLAGEFENGTTSVLSVDTFEHAAGLATESTGRDMSIRGVERSARIDNDTGSLVLAFQWTAFATVAGNRLMIGDAFQTPDGTWLPRLSERQDLLVTFPPRYEAASVSWPLRNGSVFIEGPVEFESGQPAATFRRSPPTSPTLTSTPRTPTSTGTPTPTAVDPTATSTLTPTDEPDSGAFGPVVGVVSALLLIAALAYLVRRRDAGLTPPWSSGDSDDTSPGEAAAPSGPADGSPDPETADGGTVPDGADDAGGSEDAAGGASAGTTSDAGEEEPLLSDEERVLNLLEANDGRMKQNAIVEETDWSNAKVSQLLSSMAEDGSVEKLRIGRENLIALPDELPDGAE